MRYFISAVSKDGKRFAKILAAELFRFDIRAQINGFDELDLFDSGSKNVPAFDAKEYDLVIQIGPQLDAQILRKAIRYRIKSCLIAIDSTNLKTNSVNKFDLVYWDIPIDSPKINYVGNYFLDLMNAHEYRELPPSANYRLGFLSSDPQLDRGTLKLLKELRYKYKEAKLFINEQSYVSKELKNVNFIVDSELNILKNCNLTITTNNTFSLKSALLNCPQVNIYSYNKLGFRRLFKSKSHLPVNQLLKKEVIPSFSSKKIPLIMDEIDQILTDHQYCARMMSDYQDIRAQLQSPAARNMAKEIVDFMED